MKNILLTGLPGSGKTSVILETIKRLKDIKAGGFYTQEIREKGERKGFKITSLDGRESILSHIDFKGPHKVSKYTVSIENLESIGVQALVEAIEKTDLIVIDEIGKMELFSEKFKEQVLKALDSKKKVLGTIMQASNPFADEIKKRKDVLVLEVTRENREKLIQEIINRLQNSL